MVSATGGPSFGAILCELGFRNYNEYLQSPLWASIRQRTYEEKGRQCVECRLSRAVEIHHLLYDRATMAGETLKHLAPVCEHCHEVLHGETLWAIPRPSSN